MKFVAPLMLLSFIAGLVVQGASMGKDWSKGFDSGYSSGWDAGSEYAVGLMADERALAVNEKVQTETKRITRLTGKPANLCAFAKLECQYHGK